MRKAFYLIAALLLFLKIASPSCNQNQIDINTADKNELVKIKYIGEKRAEELISLRPFNSLDELTKIKGIGEIYLKRIKDQGLACVNVENSPDEKSDKGNRNHEIGETDKKPDINYLRNADSNSDNRTIKVSKKRIPEIIKLNSQTIKSSNPNVDKNADKKNANYPIYGFIAFSVLINILFILKQIKEEGDKRDGIV